MNYGRLAQATGGILKEKKCSVYFLDYKFVCGRAKMISLHKLPPPRVYVTDNGRTYPLQISIPQPNSLDVPIETHDVTTASKMLGIQFSLAGNSSTHVEHIIQKGVDWVDCLHTKPVSRGDAWLSFYLHLFPGVLWGLVTVCMLPIKLDKSFQRVYEKALPLLGDNCKVKKEWRTLPEMYQGLALPNIPLVALSEKVSFLLGNWSFFGQAHSNALVMAYNNFLVKVGIYGSPLDWSYDDCGNLATKATWFQNLWILVQRFDMVLTFGSKDRVQGLQENNRSLMPSSFKWGIAARILFLLSLCARFEISYTSWVYQNVTASPWMNLSYLIAQKVLLCTFSPKKIQHLLTFICGRKQSSDCAQTLQPYPLF
jgi:hypothetical protein